MTENEQAARWNGPAGNYWVEARDVIDGLFRPLENVLVEGFAGGAGGRVLDVGCGTGATATVVARRIGPRGRCVGVDVSAPMLEAARARAATSADFVLADAQEHDFEPASFDAVISRFGVMFFADPVRAFANLRHAAAADAHLRMIVWRDMAENPFMTTAERAAAPLLPELPARKLDGPGQFAFADADRVRDILTKAGWSGLDVRPLDEDCTMPESELTGYFTRLGPLSLVLPPIEEPRRTRVVETVRAAFEPFVHGDEVRFTAACWLITARAAA